MATTTTLIAEARGDLQERSPNIWSDTDLLTWLNHGVQKVVVALKSIREDYFVKRLASTDAILTIFSALYDPSNLKIQSNKTIYTLPNDLVEIRSLEPLSTADKNAGVVFLPSDFSTLEFTSKRRETVSSRHTRFLFDIFGLNQLLIAPSPGQTIETELYYIYGTNLYGFGEEVVVPFYALNAIKSYCTYRALKSINHPDVGSYFAQFKDEIADCRSFSTPRQQQDVRTVEGVFDEEDTETLDTWQ